MKTTTCAIVVFALMMSLSAHLLRAEDQPVEAGKIVVLPLVAINPAEQQSWVGRQVRQAMVADLVPTAPGRVDALDTTAKDPSAAMQAARKAGARYMVTGEFATINDDVRVMGRIIDVQSGKALASIKATGSDNDLFQIEQALSDQLRRALNLGSAANPVPPVQQPQAANPPAANGFGNAQANAVAAGTDAGGSDFGPAPAAYGYGYGVGPYAYGYGYGYGYGRHFGARTAAYWELGVPILPGSLGTPSIAGGGPHGIAGLLGTPSIAGGASAGTPSVAGGYGTPSISGGGGNNLYNLPPGFNPAPIGGDFSFSFASGPALRAPRAAGAPMSRSAPMRSAAASLSAARR